MKIRADKTVVEVTCSFGVAEWEIDDTADSLFGTARIWDAARGTELRPRVDAQKAYLFSAGFSPDGKRIIIGHESYVDSAAYSPDGKHLGRPLPNKDDAGAARRSLQAAARPPDDVDSRGNAYRRQAR